MLPDKVFTISQTAILFGSILVALSAGTNYIYSAYAPQLGARLRVSHTQLNFIGLAGNMGGYFSGPIWGRIVDHKGPQMPLFCASIFLFIGYLGIKQTYDVGIGDAPSVSTLNLTLLVVCSFTTGLGGTAGLSAAMNTTMKTFSSNSRATTMGLVMSGFGLSAFFFSLLANTLFPGDAPALLLVLAIGTAIPMFIGLIIFRLVKLPLVGLNTRDASAIESYHPTPSGDRTAFNGETRVRLDAEADADTTPLLPNEQNSVLYRILTPPSPAELGSAVSLQSERGVVDVSPDIHGKELWLTPDFYLVFIIMAICSGTGLMYINNVGSISQTLYVQTHPVYDEIEASKWQTTQVSILSVANFAGRVLMGLISDFTHTRLHLPRAYCFCIVSSLFVISQAMAIAVSSIETLWMATLLLGLAYGSLFGIYSVVVMEWFGLAHFSENVGYVMFAPVLGGNAFSFLFGRNMDLHSSLVSGSWSSVGLVLRELPSEHLCVDGKACYLASFYVTLVSCILSLGLSCWAGIRDGQKVQARTARVRE